MNALYSPNSNINWKLVVYVGCQRMLFISFNKVQPFNVQPQAGKVTGYILWDAYECLERLLQWLHKCGHPVPG